MADVKKIATREGYGNALTELGQTHSDIIVFDADLAGATKTALFKKAFPMRHFNCGIAEENMMAVAAGAAAMGLDTAWYNPPHLPNPGPVTPTWEIARLEELLPLVLDGPDF